jgi:hypothetical protein
MKTLIIAALSILSPPVWATHNPEILPLDPTRADQDTIDSFVSITNLKPPGPFQSGTWELNLSDLPGNEGIFILPIELASTPGCNYGMSAFYRDGTTPHLSAMSIHGDVLDIRIPTPAGLYSVNVTRVDNATYSGTASTTDGSHITQATLVFKDVRTGLSFSPFRAILNGQPLRLPENFLFRDPSISEGIGAWVRHPDSERFYACYELTYPDGRHASVYSYNDAPYFLLLFSDFSGPDRQVAVYDKGDALHFNVDKSVAWIETKHASVVFLPISPVKN